MAENGSKKSVNSGYQSPKAQGITRGDISHIADMAGVSNTYASNILNSHPKYKQTGKKAILVWAAYDRLLAERQRVRDEFKKDHEVIQRAKAVA